jgi:hypothetical protein
MINIEIDTDGDAFNEDEAAQILRNLADEIEERTTWFEITLRDSKDNPCGSAFVDLHDECPDPS